MTYVNKVNEMTPQWMSFSIAALETLEGLTFGTEDYITYLTVGANIADVPGCEYLDLVPDVLYSVYSHRDNVDVTFNDVSYTYTYTAGGTPVCFAINLCDGTTAPIHLALPADAHDIITSIPAVRDYNDDGFNFDFHEVMVSDNGISVPTSDLPQFWDGDSYVDPAEALSDFELRLELDMKKDFYQQKNIGLRIEFTGEAYIRADEISLARDHHEEGAVQALFDGELEAVLNATFGGSMAKMDLRNDGTPFVATMPEYTTVDSVIPNGASLKLNYYENFDDAFFTTVIPVPSDAGRCPMDTFIGFTSERLISSINMQTQCPDLSINGYTFSGNDGLQLSMSLSADTGVFAVDGTLPVTTQPLNEYVAIEQADGSSAIHVEWLGSQTSGWISDLDFSLFGTSFVSRATIDNTGFRFAPEGTQTLFGTFDGVFNGTIVSGYSWEDPKIDVDGVFDAGTDSFVRNAEAYIYDYTNTKIAKSAERKQLAQSALDDTVVVAGVYQSNAQTQMSQLNDINAQVQTAQNTLASAQATLDAASALLTDDTNYLTNLFDEVCAVQNCDDFCVQSVTCSSCPLKTTVDQHGIEESTTLEEMTANREVSYSWEACALENVCRQFPRIKGWALTGIDQICNSAYVRETIMGTTYETYSEWQEILHVDSYVAQTKKLTIPQSCCATDTCGLTVSDPTCVYNNAACAFATTPVYLSLNETEQALLQPVLNYLAALSNATLLSNDLATLTAMQTAKQGIVDQQQAVYENLELDTTEAQENLDNIIAEEGPISALADTLGNTPIQTVFTITGMSFSVSVPSSTPNTLPVTIFYTVVSAGNFWHTMDIDFTATPAIINRDIADALLEQVGMKLQGQNGKKRQVDSSFNHQQFELRCARLHAVDGYLSELFRTLEATLEYQTAAMMNMSSTLAALETVVTTPTEFPHIDRLLLAGTYETDYSFDQLLQAAEADQLVVGLKQNIADLQTYLAAQQGTVESFAFASWQISIVYAHNKPFIEGIADSSCYGFSDCINTAANIIEQLLTDSTTTNAATWLAALPAARASLLQLTTATSWNISQLVSEQPSGLNYIVKQLIDEGYWCSTPPTITTHPVDTSVTVGNTLTLSCSAQSDLDIWYTWLRNGFQVASGTSGIYSKTAEAIDVGQYQCVARNAKGESLSDFAMVTVYEAPVITAHPQDYDTFLGSDQGGWFQCSATGHPDPCFEWYFGLERDTDNWVLLDDSSSQLVITNPTLSNQGWYRCKATSGDSFAWSDPAHLFVLGASISKLSYAVTVHMVVTDTVPVVSSGDSDRTNPPPAGSSWEEVRSQLISELGLQYTDVEDIEIVRDTTGDGFTLSLKLTTSFDYDPTRSVAEQAEEASEYRDGLEHGLYVLELKLQDDALWIQLDDQYYIVEHQTSIISDLEYLCPRGQIPGYSNFLCVNCTYGTHWKEVDGEGQCVACDKGTYLASDGSFDCVACPPNTDTLSDGSKWPSDCIPFCSVDYYSANGLEPCTICANFTHQPQMGQTSCIGCTDDLRGVVTLCGEPTITDRQTGSNVPAIAGGVAGGVVALLVVILLVIIILAVVLRGRGNKTEQRPGFNAGKRHSASNPLYVPPNDVLSLVPESEHVPQPIKYQVNEGKKITTADSDERDVVNPLYSHGEVEDEYDHFGPSGPSAVNRSHDGVRDQIDGDITYDEIPADTKYTMATEKSGLYSKQ